MNEQQNLATLVLTDEQVSAVEGALNLIDSVFGNRLVTLSPTQKRQAQKMGKGSVGFCKQTLVVLKQHPQILPANFNIDDAMADFSAREKLQPLLTRISALFQRVSDTDLALGSDVMAAALQGYRHIKVSGRSAGLDSLKRELGDRFAKNRRSKKTMPTDGMPTS